MNVSLAMPLFNYVLMLSFKGKHLKACIYIYIYYVSISEHDVSVFR